MGWSDWTPSIVPKGDDQNVYLVIDDLGRKGAFFRKPTSRPPVGSDRRSVQGQFPVRVVAFNTVEHWSQDVSADVAHELHRRCAVLR